MNESLAERVTEEVLRELSDKHAVPKPKFVFRFYGMGGIFSGCFPRPRLPVLSVSDVVKEIVDTTSDEVWIRWLKDLVAQEFYVYLEWVKRKGVEKIRSELEKFDMERYEIAVSDDDVRGYFKLSTSRKLNFSNEYSGMTREEFIGMGKKFQFIYDAYVYKRMPLTKAIEKSKTYKPQISPEETGFFF